MAKVIQCDNRTKEPHFKREESSHLRLTLAGEILTGDGAAYFGGMILPEEMHFCSLECLHDYLSATLLERSDG